ncbi:3-hydroxyacyl-CoA dehydrogenase family protein [Emcibacter sp.]|uniref:3-hydroxyacyl-CoA dehydrogenase family protein n=1 Tax=Emcibacter sp. TaxID=1979954 RepID=UPI003A8F1478
MKIGVVGAGLMGAEIALVFALGGMPVVLNDLDEAALERAMLRLAKLLDKGVDRGFYTPEDRNQALAHITPATDLESLADCDLVTEAVFEALEAKKAVLQSLDALCRPDCIIASNTSTLPISTLAATLSPARRPLFLGTHYFSPVSRMKLVEVVPGFDSDPAVTGKLIDILRNIGKSPVEIKDVAGFAVNRMLHAMLIEAIKLVEEGVATPEDLDIACQLGLGHPIGPFALMDAVSSGLCLQVQEILQEAYGERFRPPALLKQRVAAGLVGGRGQPGWIRKDS